MKKIVLLSSLIFPLSLCAAGGNEDNNQNTAGLLGAATALATGDQDDVHIDMDDVSDSDSDESQEVAFVERHKVKICAGLTCLLVSVLGGVGGGLYATSPEVAAHHEIDHCAAICHEFASSSGMPAMQYYDLVRVGDVETYTLKDCPEAGRGDPDIVYEYELHDGLPVCVTAISYNPDLPADAIFVNTTDTGIPNVIERKK